MIDEDKIIQEALSRLPQKALERIIRETIRRAMDGEDSLEPNPSREIGNDKDGRA